MNPPIEISVRSDRIGKVFCVVSRGVGQCLICDGLFTSRAAAVHTNTQCFPWQRSFDRVGETKDANR